MFLLRLQFLLETVSFPFMYLLCHKYAAGSLHLSYTTASTRWRHLLRVESMRQTSDVLEHLSELFILFIC